MIVTEIEKIDDDIFELENFTLNTNLNANLKAMTKEECQTRFAKLIEIKFQRTLKVLELESKQATYAEYFADAPVKKASK